MVGISIKENLNKLLFDINEAAQKSGRTGEQIRLIAVSKLQSIETMQEALAAGIENFGENYVQEAVEKFAHFADQTSLQWHFIGHLQTNKVKYLVNKIHWLHTLDRIDLAKKLSQKTAGGKKINCLIQVNVSGEDQKNGLREGELAELLDRAQELPNLKISGLMTMPPWTSLAEENRQYFCKLKEICDRFKDRLSFPHSLDHLSMGTSQDFKVAIEEGATMVRVGSSLLGERN